MSTRHIAAIVRWLLGGLLLYSGFAKLGDPYSQALLIAGYRLLSAQAAQILAVTLPWIELLAGALLVLGLWTRPAAMCAAILMAAFALASTQALARGLNIECGCFDPSSGHRLTALSIVLQAACLTGAIALTWLEAGIPARKKTG